MKKGGKIVSFPGGEQKGGAIPEEADFSLDSGIRQKLLETIKQDVFGELSDDDLTQVNAAGMPYAITKQGEGGDTTER